VPGASNMYDVDSDSTAGGPTGSFFSQLRVVAVTV
jgi:hypothetical protein